MDGQRGRSGSALIIDDDQFLGFGTGRPVLLGYETADTNANVIILAMAEGGAIDVPVFVIGDASIVDLDLALFDGITEPAIAVIDDDADSYIKMGFVLDDIAEILSDSPIRITPGTDVHFTDGTGVVVGHTAQITVGGLLPEFQVMGIDNVAGQISVTNFAADTQGSIVSLSKSRGALGTVGTTIVTGDNIGQISFYGDDGTDLAQEVAQILIVSSGTVGANRIPGEIQISTAVDSAGSALAVALTLDNAQKAIFAGNVDITGSVLSFDSAVTIDSSGNNLITIDGVSAGIRLNNFVGIDTVPDANIALRISRTVSPVGNYRGIFMSDITTLSATKTGYGLDIAPSFTEATSGTHAIIAALNITAFTVTDGGGSEAVTNLASIYIVGAPIAGTTPANGPYSIFVDAGDVRIDDNLLIGATSKVWLDGGTDTYIVESAADIFDIVVGAHTMLKITESTTLANYAGFIFDAPDQVDEASASGSTWRLLQTQAVSVDWDGGTTIDALNGQTAYFDVITNTADQATTVTVASSVYIAGPPIVGSNITYGSKYALHIDLGDLRVDGELILGNDADNVSGKINFIASDGDAADIAINTSDQLLFSNAGGGYVFDASLTITGGINTVSNLDIDLIPNGTGNVNILGTSVSDNYDLGVLGGGILMLIEGTEPTADSGYGKLWFASDNEVHVQTGDGNVHTLSLLDIEQAFSNIWFHAQASVAVSIGTADTFVLIDSFTVVGKEDTGGNVTGSVSTNLITIGSGVGGEYDVEYHGSVTNAGGGGKEMLIVPGITLNTRLDITVVTDNTITPIVITSTAHGLEDGDMVTIVDVLVNTAANGDFIVDNKTADTFEIVALDGTATVGNGDYDEGTPTGEVSILYPGNLISHVEVSNANLDIIAADGIDQMSAADTIGLYVANLDDTSNFNVAAMSLRVVRIGN